MRLSVISFLVVLLLGCNHKESALKIEQITTNEPVIMGYNSKYQKIIRIQIPIKISITNTGSYDKIFTRVEYKYAHHNKGLMNLVYIKDRDSLKMISVTSKKQIKPNASKEYYIYSQHLIDSTKSTQKELLQYLNRFRNNESGFYKVEPVNNFKVYNPKFYENLIKGDSLAIRTWNQAEVKSIGVSIKF